MLALNSRPSAAEPAVDTMMMSGYLACTSLYIISKRSQNSGPWFSLPMPRYLRLKGSGCPISARILPHLVSVPPLQNSMKSRASHTNMSWKRLRSASVSNGAMYACLANWQVTPLFRTGRGVAPSDSAISRYS